MLLNELTLAWRDDRRAEGGDVFRLTRSGAGSGLDRTASAYDGLSRLASSAGALGESWTLDAASNITSRTDPAQANTFDGANRLLSDGAAPGPTAASARVAGATRTYGYDSDGPPSSRWPS